MTEQQRQQQEYQRRMQEAMMQQQQAQQALQFQMAQAQQRAVEHQQMIDVEPRQKYAIIAAVDLQAGIGKDGQIPWNYPADLKWFKQKTVDQVCVMGRKTYQDINTRLGEKAKESVLPNRKCFVVSSTLKQEDVPNATVIKYCYDVGNFLNEEDLDKTVFFIGGEQIFVESLSLAQTVYITAINQEHNCDTKFPIAGLDKLFKVDTVQKVEDVPDIRFVTYIRK